MPDSTPDPPLQFDALVEILPWGRNVYTILKIPDELAARARTESTRRVEGHVEGVDVNVGLNRSDVTPDSFIYVGKGLQRRLGVRAGDVVRCVLAPADPDHVPLPDDVREALERAGRLSAFDRMPAPERRRLLMPIEGAARTDTRARRLAALVSSVTADSLY